MRAVQVSERGGPEVLKVVELPDPSPAAGQIAVRVEAAGVNFVDVYQRTGLYQMPLPFVLGSEGAGTVVAVGDGVSRFKPGDRVAWPQYLGSYAERVVLPADRAVHVPDGVATDVAAAVMLQGLTAQYLATSTYPLEPGDTCLVHAAAGGVGLLLCQVAKLRGARVIGTVSTEEKAVAAKAAGLDHAVVLAAHEDPMPEVMRLTAGRGVDYVVDGVAGVMFRRDLAMVAERGRICVFGRAGGAPEPFSPLELLEKSVIVSGGFMTNFLRSREEVLRKAGDVWRGLRDGWLVPRLHAVVPFSEAAAAHRMLENRLTIGKVVLTVGGDGV